MQSRSLGHRAPLLWLVVPLMSGLAAGKAGELAPVPWLLAAAIVGAVGTLATSRDHPRCFALALCFTAFFAGMASYSLHRARLPAWDQLPPREAQLTLRIDRVLMQADTRRAAGLATVTRAGEPLAELRDQRVYFSLTLRKDEVAPIRSAVISAVGVLVALPRDPPGDTFDGYLANAGVNFRLNRGRLIAEEKPASTYYRFCARASARFATLLGMGVAAKQPELVGVLRAMLLGQRHELSDEHKEMFRHSGTMHVFSISGLHIGVIATGLHALLSLLRLPRPVHFGLGLVALWLYVDITGAAPSAVRAFVMVAVFQVALAWRLPRNPLSALATSALIIVVIDPLQVFSASFQMSYGIMTALLLLGLPLADCWQERLALFRDLPKVTWGWQRRGLDYAWRVMLGVAAIGTAASLISAVTGVLFFNLFTPGAFLANLWLIPIASVSIYMGMLSLIFGIAGFHSGTELANHAAVLLLSWIETGIRHSADVPTMWFAAEFRGPWWGPVALSAVMVALLVGYSRDWRGWQRGYWAPFAVVALAFVFGVTFP